MSAIRFIVPFGRDGAADRAARAFTGAFTTPLHIENLPGEGGLLGVSGANALAGQGKPVLMLGTPTTHVLLPSRYGEDGAPHHSFRALLGLGTAPNVLLASPKLGVLSLEAFISRARRETLTYASAGVGQTIHVCSALFCAETGLTMRHIPYSQGSALAYADLFAGRVQMYFDSLLGCREHIDQGDVVPLAVSSRNRHALLPGIPTLAECGFPNHALDVWLGVFAANFEDGQGEYDLAALANALAELGLAGGPIGGAALFKQVHDSRPLWLRACDHATE